MNLSRISPLELHTVYTSHDCTRSALHVDQRHAICLSPIYVHESQLLTASETGIRNKFIKGVLHEQEMQRFVGATCMAFGHGTVLHAQIVRDCMTFGTNGSWNGGTSSIFFSFSNSITPSRVEVWQSLLVTTHAIIHSIQQITKEGRAESHETCVRCTRYWCGFYYM